MIVFHGTKFARPWMAKGRIMAWRSTQIRKCEAMINSLEMCTHSL